MENKTRKKTPHKIIIMHNFDYEEMNAIIKTLRTKYGNRKHLFFAKSTEHSLKKPLGELIEDMTEDHEYLMKNPPPGKTNAE